jgi:hypothetical protein
VGAEPIGLRATPHRRIRLGQWPFFTLREKKKRPFETKTIKEERAEAGAAKEK